MQKASERSAEGLSWKAADTLSIGSAIPLPMPNVARSCFPSIAYNRTAEAVVAAARCTVLPIAFESDARVRLSRGARATPSHIARTVLVRGDVASHSDITLTNVRPSMIP